MITVNFGNAPREAGTKISIGINDRIGGFERRRIHQLTCWVLSFFHIRVSRKISQDLDIERSLVAASVALMSAMS